MKAQRLISFTCLFFIVYFGILCNNVLAQQIVEHHDSTFELNIPDNFKSLPENLMPKGWLYGFKERTGMRDEPQITIGIEKSLELIKDKHKRLEMLKKKFSHSGASISTKNFYAKSGEIQGIEVINAVDKVKSIMFIAELPAGGEFIQIIVGGNTQRDQEISRIFSGILLSFIANDDYLKRYSRVITVIVLLLAIFIIFF